MSSLHGHLHATAHLVISATLLSHFLTFCLKRKNRVSLCVSRVGNIGDTQLMSVERTQETFLPRFPHRVVHALGAKKRYMVCLVVSPIVAPQDISRYSRSTIICCKARSRVMGGRGPRVKFKEALNCQYQGHTSAIHESKNFLKFYTLVATQICSLLN